MKVYNPSSVHTAPTYNHGVEVPPNARWLYISGQVGIDVDGKTGATFARQAELAWSNLLAILAAGGMGVGDLVKVTIYLTRAEDIAESRAVRQRVLGDTRPASTLVVIPRLAAPEYLIEVEAHAAKA